MFAKIAVLCAVVAVAYAGVLVSPPASTTLLANTVVAAPVAHVAAVRTIAAPAVVAAPVAHSIVAAAPVAHTVIAAPHLIHTGNKIVHTVEPVEQHGYKIVY